VANGAPMILVMFEMPAVNPVQHNIRTRKLFDLVFVPNPLLAKEYGGFYFDFPIDIFPFSETPPTISYDELKISYIATNKNSLVRSSLYSKRGKLINIFAKTFDMALAGKDWDDRRRALILNDLKYFYFMIRHGLFPSLGKFFRSKVSLDLLSYRGEIESKSDLILLSTLVLVIENDIFELSEKLFDVLALGRVPIYFGGSLSNYGFDSKLCFCFSPEKISNRTIQNVLTLDNIEKKMEYIKQNRKSIQRWSADRAFRQLAEAINRSMT
jgi:hypothetical protein